MRKKKWLRRGLYFVVFLVVIYLLFWWALFNPLESDVESLVALVPSDAHYMVHSLWGDLRTSDLVEKGFLDSRLKQEIDYNLDLERYLYEPLREVEAQVNQSVPGFFGKISILDDFAGREVVVAGRFKDDGDELAEMVGNSPFVLLTRITTKAKFMEVLRYGFVHEKIPDLEPFKGYFRFDLGEDRVRPGAPEDARYMYFSRIRDVLAVSNDSTLIQEVVRLGISGEDATRNRETLPSGNYWFYWDVLKDDTAFLEQPGVTVWFRVWQSDSKLKYLLRGRRNDEPGGFASILRAFFPVPSTNTLTLHFGAGDEETVQIRSKIRMDDTPGRDLDAWIAGFHQNEGEEIGPHVKRWAGYAPADRTFLFTWLGMSAEDCFTTLFHSLGTVSRRAWFGNPLAERSADDWTDSEFASRVGRYFEDGVGIALTRLPEVDKIDLDSFDGGIPEPRPALTFFLNETSSLDPQNLVDFFLEYHERFGVKEVKELEAENARLFALSIPTDQSLGLIKPGFALVGRQFILSTNVDELKRMLDIAAGQSGPLLAKESFVEILGKSHELGKLFLYVDGPQLGQFLRDQRQLAASEAVRFDELGFRTKVLEDIDTRHPGWNTKRRQEEADRLFDERVRVMKREHFPLALRDYLQSLFWAESIGWVGFSANVAGDTSGVNYLDLRGAARLDLRNER